MEKYCKEGQATDLNMPHAHCMLDNKGYIHTLTIRNTYCFSMATMAARNHLNVTLQVLILILIYLLTAIGLTPDGSRLVRIAATELPLRVNLGVKLAGPLCATI
jgi:hypothetical protein